MALNLMINSHKPEDVSLLNGLHYGAFTGFLFSMLTMGINYFSFSNPNFQTMAAIIAPIIGATKKSQS